MRLIRQHNIINGLLLIAAVSVSSCNSILEDDSLPVSNKNIEISFTRSSESMIGLDDNGTFKVAFSQEQTIIIITQQITCQELITTKKMHMTQQYLIQTVLRYMQ